LSRGVCVLLAGWIGLLPVQLFAQREGPISLIEDPQTYFTDERQSWIGREICFLPCPNAAMKNPYFDWYYNPYDLNGSKPRKRDLLWRRGMFEAVYLGQIHMVKPHKDYWRMGFFWKVRLLDDNSVVYYWDDGESGVFNFGFVDDFQEARKHIGQKLWSRKRHVLYSMDGKNAILLRHLEPVYLKDVRWGDYGNFPLKFVLETQNGKLGYVWNTTYAKFVDEWYTYDPRERFRYVRLQDWALIEHQQLRMNMSPEMVLLSWGDPSHIETRRTKDGSEEEIWTYPGVAETKYFVYFRNRKLIRVRWEQNKKK